MINLISVILVYLCARLTGSGSPLLVTQAVVFGLFYINAIVTGSNKLIKGKTIFKKLTICTRFYLIDFTNIIKKFNHFYVYKYYIAFL